MKIINEFEILMIIPVPINFTVPTNQSFFKIKKFDNSLKK